MAIDSTGATATDPKGVWPGGVVDWWLHDGDFPVVPVAHLSTDTIQEDGSWAHETDCQALSLPSGSAFFHMDEDSPQVDAACREIREVLQAMKTWEAQVPGVRFEPHLDADVPVGSNYLGIEVGSGAYATPGGVCTYNVHRWSTFMVRGGIGYHDDGANNRLRLSRSKAQCKFSTYLHEFGHVLGLFHTQGRSDRDDFVTYDGSSVGPLMGINNWTPPGFQDVGPFDFKSVMLYRSYASNTDKDETAGEDCATATSGDYCGTVTLDTGTLVFDLSNTELYRGVQYQTHRFNNDNLAPRVTADPDCFDPGVTKPEGYQLKRTIEGPGGEVLAQFTAPTTPEGEDARELLFADVPAALADPDLLDFGCYEVKLDDRPEPWAPDFIRAGFDLTDSRFATFNDSDVISPVDTSGVLVNYGQWHPGATFGSALDNFGAATASGDFDDDGVQDLAIAAPHPGQVFLYKGVYRVNDTTGYIDHRPWRVIQAGPPDSVTDLAVGDFDGDAVQDLAIGLANRFPSGEVAILSKAGPRGKRFGYLARLTNITAAQGVFAGSTTIKPPTWPLASLVAYNARFGDALAVGDMDGDGKDDLAIGCPACYPMNFDPAVHVPSGAPGGWSGAFEETGAVFLVTGTGSGGPNQPVVAPLSLVVDPYSDPTVRGSHQLSEFGAAIALARPAAGGHLQLFVGGPGAFRLSPSAGTWTTLSGLSGGSPIRVGRVWRFGAPLFLPRTPFFTFRQQFTFDEANGRFGAALAAAPDYYGTRAQGILAVGSPKGLVPAVSSAPPGGAVGVYEVLGPSSLMAGPGLRLDGATFTPVFSDCAVTANDGFGTVIRFGYTDSVPNSFVDPGVLAIGAPGADQSCFDLGLLAPGQVDVYEVTPIENRVLLGGPVPHAMYRVGNPDPAWGGPSPSTGFAEHIEFFARRPTRSASCPGRPSGTSRAACMNKVKSVCS